jgi:hypothetical protein
MTTTIDKTRLEAFMSRAFTDISAVFSVPLLNIGENSACRRQWHTQGR